MKERRISKEGYTSIYIYIYIYIYYIYIHIYLYTYNGRKTGGKNRIQINRHIMHMCTHIDHTQRRRGGRKEGSKDARYEERKEGRQEGLRKQAGR
jgi:hypothetical protein